MPTDRRFRRHRGTSGLLRTLLGLAIVSTLVMLLWNALLPGLAAVPSLGWLQAAGLTLLARLLLGRAPTGHHSVSRRPQQRCLCAPPAEAG
jgi:hypothetical protein